MNTAVVCRPWEIEGDDVYGPFSISHTGTVIFVCDMNELRLLSGVIRCLISQIDGDGSITWESAEEGEKGEVRETDHNETV